MERHVSRSVEVAIQQTAGCAAEHLHTPDQTGGREKERGDERDEKGRREIAEQCTVEHFDLAQ